jgi:GTP cyclohydrolase I
MPTPFKMDKTKLKQFDLEETDCDNVIETCIYNLLVALGDDPEREGLKGTPDRVRRMYHEVFAGMKLTNSEIAQRYNKCFEEGATGDLVTIADIPIFSYCEHHIALMYNMKVHVGYIPKGKVIGLSKVARIADMVSRRLQLQERIGADIADVLEQVLDTDDIIVVIEGEHSCMTARGIKKPGTKTRTATLRGLFKTDGSLRQEFYSLVSKI